MFKEIQKLQQKSFKILIPGPCELTADIPDEDHGHGLGDFTPDEVPETPDELKELYKANNITSD